MPDFNHYLHELKAGAKVSKATADQISNHVTALNDLATQHSAMAIQHTTASKQLKDMADNLSTVIGSPAYGDESDTTKNFEPRQALTQNEQPDNSTVEIDFSTLLANELKARIGNKNTK